MKHTIICGHVLDVLKTLPDESVDTVITSPPYWSLRSYLPDDHPDKAKEIGLEPTLDLYIEHLLDVMRELKRILKKTGVIFWNHGDCYGRYYWDQDAIRTPLKAATKERVKHAFNPSKGDIQGAVKHTGAQHFAERVNQGELTGANRPNVWQINLEPTSFPHYAPFPSSLVSSCLLAGCPRYVCKKCGRPRQRITDKNYLPIRPGLNTGKGKSGTDSDPNKSLHQRDISRYRMQIQYKTLGWSDCGCNAGYDSGVVMDIFAGTGTVGVVAEQMGFNSIQIDLNKEYCEIAYQRLKPLVAQTKLGREPSVIERIGF